jgi:transcriptional regulator with XRE-family HTH domain
MVDMHGMVLLDGPDHQGPAGRLPGSPTLGCGPGVIIGRMDNDLATCLRAWRDRIDPAEVGLPRPASRRAPGLRREEVAAQAGISVNYLMRLEQGHASRPSRSVVSALARALRLDGTEAAHLHQVAGHADSTSRVAARHITPSVQRMLGRFDDVPLIVIDPAWTIVAANPLARALLGDDVVGQNAARSQFLGPSWVEREAEDEERFDRELVGDLHLRQGLHPDDAALRTLIAELRASSERFATLWADAPASASAASRKTFRHPTTGPITVDCDTLEVVGSDLRIVIWSAAPGSPDASALALLGVVGTQQFHT